MQNYLDFAAKNGTQLLESGPCQLCGATTVRGVHECLEIFNLGFASIDYGKQENHRYRFLSVDAHCLQHPELHGRWSNHFHLLRQHLVFSYQINWSYRLSPVLSDHLNAYKPGRSNEVLEPPPVLYRGTVTSTDVLELAKEEETCKAMVEKWGQSVYSAWQAHHASVNDIARSFVEKHFP